MRRVVIGLGNRMRGDDAAGLEVARIVRERSPTADVRLHEREPSDLIALWEGASLAVVVDAVDGGSAGEIHRFELTASESLPEGWRESRPASTHAFGLREVVELASSLRRLPPRLVVIGICGHRFETGKPLSGAARVGVDAAVAAVLAELDS